MTREDFVSKFGGVYEHSAWIAEQAFLRIQSFNAEDIHAAMKEVLAGADKQAKLALICAHPDLACAPADLGKLTQSSVSEQKGAGLNQCSPEEFAEFQQLNADYKKKFGFPFIIAVKGLTRLDILQFFRKRIAHAEDAEFATALEQINKIAGFRISALLQAP